MDKSEEEIFKNIEKSIKREWLKDGETPWDAVLDIHRRMSQGRENAHKSVMALRDWIWNRQEEEVLESKFSCEKDLYLPIFRIVSTYHSVLNSLLIEPISQKPYFLVGKSKPWSDFLEVTIPQALKWIFSDSADIHLWVNPMKPMGAVWFLKVISAVCVGIENLLDIEKLINKFDFFIPTSLIEKHTGSESLQSQVRRLAIQSISPIFSSEDLSFSPEDMQFHALAFLELSKIPSVSTWHKRGMSHSKYRNLLYLLALVLDRIGEEERAYTLLSLLGDDKVYFHKARISSKLGQFDRAKSEIQRAVEIKPHREFYKTCLFRIMEEMPIQDPFSRKKCPNIMKIYNLVTLKEEDEFWTENHLSVCEECQRWYRIMQELAHRCSKID